MSDKISLTKEHENCDCHEMLKKTDVCMPEKCHIIHEDTLDLYDMYQEKADKLDQITLRGTRPVTADWIREQAKLLLDLEQENKKLTEDLENTINQLDMRNGSIDNLKQTLENIKQLWKNKPSKWVESMYEILD